MKPLAELIAELLMVASLAVPGAAPVAPPTVEWLDPPALQQKACGKPCKALAWYEPGGGIYLDKRIDPWRNIIGRSILLHELVHHVQFAAGKDKAVTCKDWLTRETQAYRLQASWLFKQGIDATALIWRARTMRCDPAGMKRRGQAHSK